MAYFRRYFIVILVLVLGVGASAIGFAQFVLIEENDKERSFVLAASDRAVVIERSIQSNLDSVLSIKFFFESNLLVKRDQFASFVASVLKRNVAVKALEWVPVVPAKERKAYVSAAQSEGFKNFDFLERSEKGKLVKAGARQDYYPVFFLEPMKGNEGAFGFDLGSSVSRRKALEAARDKGQISTSESITLVQNGQKGVLLFAPIYKTGVSINSVELRRQNITGFALGVAEIKTMIEAAFVTHKSIKDAGGIDFYVYDSGKKIGDPLIYIHQSRRRTNSRARRLSQAQTQTGFFVSHTVKVGNRDWLFVARPVVPMYGAGIPQSAWGVLILGLILSGTIAVFLKSNIDRNHIVENLVIERTSELSTKTEQIKLMHDVTVISNEANTVEEATQTCIDLICQRMNWQVGHAYIVTKSQSVSIDPSEIWYVEDEEKYKKFKDITMRSRYDLGAGVPGLVLAEEAPVWVSVRDSNKKSLRRIEGDLLGLNSAVGLPVMVGSEVVAVLEFFYTGGQEPDQTLLQSLRHIGAQLGRVF